MSGLGDEADLETWKADITTRSALGGRADFRDRWQTGDADAVESFTIIVGAAPPSIAPYHDRAPVILEQEHLDVWLDPATDPKMLGPLLAPFDGALTIEPVSKAVNNPKNDFPQLLEPVAT